MDSNNGGKIHSFHHHHHHHGGGGGGHHHHVFYVSPHCPFHRPILQPKNHSPSCSFSTTYPYPQNAEPVALTTPDPQLSFLDTHPNTTTFDDSQMIQDENEMLEEEEEGDPIFVLTDEWRDFFAKSEAKRRQAKKQAKKGKK